MQSSSPAYDNSADDGLDLLRSMIAGEHHGHNNADQPASQPPQQPQIPAHHASSRLTIDNMDQLLRGSRRSSRLSTQDDDDDDDVDMLRGIADADDGGSLASFNPDTNNSTTYAGRGEAEDDEDMLASPPSSPNRNGRRGGKRPTENESHSQRMQVQYQRGPPMSPIKRSRELADTCYANDDDGASDNRSYLQNTLANANAHQHPPQNNMVLHVQDMFEDEAQHQEDYADTSFRHKNESSKRRTSSVSSNTTSKAGNGVAKASLSSDGDEYTHHRDNPLLHSSSVEGVHAHVHAHAHAHAHVEVDHYPGVGDRGRLVVETSTKDTSDNSPTKKVSSNKSIRTKSVSGSNIGKPTTANNNIVRSKTHPPSSSSSSQRPLAVGLPPPPPPHLIEQFQTQAKSQAFHMMAVQHLPAHIQAEAAAAAQAAVAIVAARAGVTVPSVPTPTSTTPAAGTGARAACMSGGAQPQQPPQLTPQQQLQMFQSMQMQMQAQFLQYKAPGVKAKNQQPQSSSQGPGIDYAAAGEAVAAAAAKASGKKVRDSDLPQVVTTNAAKSPLSSPTTSDKRIKQISPMTTAKENPMDKQSSAHAGIDSAMTPPTMPNTPLTSTAALSSSTLDADLGSAHSHYFSVSDKDDQSVSSVYSASSRGSGTVSCSSGACRGPMKRRVTSASSISTSSGGKAKQQQAKKTPRQAKKRGGAASPKGSARSRQSSSSSSYRGGPARSMQRARSYTAPGNINGSNGFGIQIPPVPMGPLSPLPSPPIGSPLPDVRSMRVASPPRTSLTPTPSSAERPRNRASTAPLVRQHSYPVTANSKTSSKAPPATPVPPQFFHPAAMTGTSPPPALKAAATSESSVPYSSTKAATTPATPANAWLGQPPSSLPLAGGVSPVPFYFPPFAMQGMPMMAGGQQPNQQQAKIQCWCGGSYKAGSKEAETEHAMTTQHKDWIARSQAQFYKMQNGTSSC